jgi:uncharacterized phosphosugar-binding protein
MKGGMKKRSQLFAGFAAVDITPVELLPMGGYIARNEPSAGTHGSLYAKAIASRSGEKSAMALEIKKRGKPVIAITSLLHSGSVTPSHASGKRLMVVADVVLDNGAPYGDARIKFPGVEASMGATSTVTGAALINSVLILAAEKMLAKGSEPIILPSGNVLAADYTRIQTAMEKYIGRTRYL